MPIFPYGNLRPRIDPTAFVAPGAFVVGDVALGPEVSVWFAAVVRGDSAAVLVGARTNIQDGAVLHTDAGSPCDVGQDCTVGHRAIVHGCTVRGGCLIGMGSILLSGAVIGEESLVAAGALVPEGKRIPSRSLVVGAPARIIRTLSDEDVARLIRPGVETYRRTAQDYGGSLG